MTDRPVFDEMWGTGETLREPYRKFHDWFSAEDPARLRAKQREAEELFRLTGITFNVYGRAEAEERLIPFDIIPRIISAARMAQAVAGIEQRVRAINAFLHDIYHRQEIVSAGRIPEEMIVGQRGLPAEDDRRRRRRAASTPTSSASTSCAPATTSSTCSRTMPARPRASATCSRTARRCCRCSPSCSRRTGCSRCRTIPRFCTARSSACAPRGQPIRLSWRC